ncbi:MAG: endopeptidase La, partial [Clostridiales bacterium]|nr:endopeptidase La [Clostridiales bacterium]
MPKNEPVTAALPVVAMRGVILFPKMTLHFDVGRKRSVAALKAALSESRDVFLCAQRDLSEEEPHFTNLCPVGVVASITQIVRLPNSDNIRVVVEGKYRAYVAEIIKERPYLYAVVEERFEKPVRAAQLEYEQALVRRAKDIFEEYADETMHLAPDVAIGIISEKRAGALADYIAGNISLPPEEKQH